jgi:hypothetical protein
MQSGTWVSIAMLLPLLGGCAGLTVYDRPSGRPVALTLCAKGETPQQKSTLYFGAARPDGGSVSDAEWAAFLADTATPAFPDGLTWFDAHGQWRGAEAAVVREPSRVLVLLHGADAASLRRVQRLADAYARRFAQEAVLRERTAVCMRL